MDNTHDSPHPEPHRRKTEYDDPHFHDEDLEIGSSEDAERRRARPVGRKKPARRPPPRRHYDE